MIRSSSHTVFTKFDKAAEEQDRLMAQKGIERSLVKMLKSVGDNPPDILKMAEVFRVWAERLKVLDVISQNPVYYLNNLKSILQKVDVSDSDSDQLVLKKILENEKFLTTLFAEMVLPSQPVDMKKRAALIQNLRSWQDRYSFRDNINQLVESEVGWRLFVDGIKQEVETPISYDSREPGCLIAMARAFNVAMEHIEEDLTFQHIIDIHDACVHKVAEMSDIQQEHAKESYRQGEEIVGFGLTSLGKSATLTSNGKRELCLHEGIDRDYTIRCNRVLAILHGGALKKRIDYILNQYNQKMKGLSKAEDKISCIVSMAALLERIHPFYDANCRSICVLVLNRELLKHGFPPVILDDPNRFDAFSIDELMEEVLNGFENYQHVLKTGKFPGEEERIFDPKDISLMQNINVELHSINHKRKAKDAFSKLGEFLPKRRKNPSV